MCVCVCRLEGRSLTAGNTVSRVVDATIRMKKIERVFHVRK